MNVKYVVSGNGWTCVADDYQPKDREIIALNVPDDSLVKEYIAEARMVRDNILRSCDWTQMPDVELSAQVKEKWMQYRKLLRDLPAKEGFPDCSWPESPK